ATRASVVACTLLPYEDEFELAQTLEDSLKPVRLNHKYCAQFCVLGGASCSA
ncbi:MAG TPA: radical SAM protein, partial [Oceanicaulis sp.]|nr:radical SAM protein [Oceanicaulis sp.]